MTSPVIRPASKAGGRDTQLVPDPQRQLATHPLWEASSDGLVLVDNDGTVLATNRSFDRLFGHEGDALIGQPIEVVVPASSRAEHANLREEYQSAPTPRPMAASRHLEGRRADGTTFPINVSLGRLSTATGDHSFAAVHDLTDRIQLEAEAAKLKRQQAMAEERERIAHDLHDTVIQRLFALGIGLQALPDQVQEEIASAKISAAVDTIDDVIDDLRSAIYGLRHQTTAGAPLRDRLLAVIDEMRPSLGFAPGLHIDGDLDLVDDPAITDHLLAVAREALSNTARHADATSATVTILMENGHLSLEVVDNGIGLKQNVIRSGLANLADRAVALDGHFEVRRHEPAGTLLRWVVPALSPLRP